MSVTMEYPFTEGQEYLTKDQQVAVDEFILREGNECAGGWVYENGDGQKRMVMRTFLPVGCKSPLTVRKFFPGPDGGHTRFHTPLATNVGGDVKITFRDMKTGDVAACTSVEWFKWCGKAVKGIAPSSPEATAAEETLRAMVVAQMKKGEDKRDEQKKFEKMKAEEDASKK